MGRKRQRDSCCCCLPSYARLLPSKGRSRWTPLVRFLLGSYIFCTLLFFAYPFINTILHPQVVKIDGNIQTSLGVWPYIKRDRYPKRVNMSVCEPRYGKIGVFVAINNVGREKYKVALESLECYLKSTPYEYFLVNTESDPEVLKHCSQEGHSSGKAVKFRKHCAATLYLPKVDWLMLLDADTGVVNPNHCIEEYIDNRANIILYERAYIWELMVGNYMVRNSQMGRDFLMEIAEGGDYKFFGSEQGILPYATAKLVVPYAKHEIDNCFNIWKSINHSETSYNKYGELFKYNSCCKQLLGGTHFWPGKMRIYRRFHGWARDSGFNQDNWNEVDFMIHNWKPSNLTEKWQSPFKTIPDPAKCGRSYDGWDWRPEKRVSIETLREQIAKFEKNKQDSFPKASRGLSYLERPDVRECFPGCEDFEE